MVFWRRKRHRVDQKAAEQANHSAQKSLEQAQHDLNLAEYKLLDSKRITERIKQHNEANHYDDWLNEQFLKYYSKH